MFSDAKFSLSVVICLGAMTHTRRCYFNVGPRTSMTWPDLNTTLCLYNDNVCLGSMTQTTVSDKCQATLAQHWFSFSCFLWQFWFNPILGQISRRWPNIELLFVQIFRQQGVQWQTEVTANLKSKQLLLFVNWMSYHGKDQLTFKLTFKVSIYFCLQQQKTVTVYIEVSSCWCSPWHIMMQSGLFMNC